MGVKDFIDKARRKGQDALGLVNDVEAFPYFLWECRVDQRGTSDWFYILELRRRPDEHTMTELRSSQFMYGWLDTVWNDDTNKQEGIACWHARHPTDPGECVALYQWIDALMKNAKWDLTPSAAVPTR